MRNRIFCLTLALVGGLFSCEPEVVEPTDPGTGGETPEPSSYYISYNLGGTSIMEENGQNGYFSTSSNGKSIDASSDYISVSPGGGFYKESADYSTVSFNNNEFSLSTYTSDEEAALASIFTVGTHPFKAESSGEKGVTAEIYLDGVSWSTDNGDQPASATFNVTESVASTNAIGEAERKVKGTFSCVFFNGSGESKSVESGEFYLLFTAP